MRKFLVLPLVLGLLCSLAFINSCGQQSSSGSSGGTVTISGTVTVSSSDLAQLGAATFSVKGSSAGAIDLTTKGYSKSSINALNLAPLDVSGTIITIGMLNVDGSITAVATETVSSDGSYSVDVANFDSDETYAAVVLKTSGTKTLEMKTIYPAPTSGAIQGSDAAISPQTTLVAQMIIEKVIKVLESANVDPDVISNVKDAIVEAVNILITSGTITLTAVRDATAADNQALLTAVDRASSDTTISSKLDSVRGALGLAKATDLETAKGAMFELFKIMTGDPKGVPEEIVTAFARAFVNGVTKNTSQIATAINASLFNPATQQSTTAVSFTASQVATEIQNMLRGVYASGSSVNSNQYEAPPAGVLAVVEAVFPKSEWQTKTITSSTTFSVPQMFLLIHVGERLAYSQNLQFNSPKAAYELGLMEGIEDKAQIMHSELRIITFEDWANVTDPTQPPQAIRALTSWVDVGNVVNPDPTETQNYTCWLQYPKASGGLSSPVKYTVQQMMGGMNAMSVPFARVRAAQTEMQMGPPPGWKNYSINPWGSGPGQEGTKITDFTGGTAIITVKSGATWDTTTIDSKEVTVVNIDLTTAVPDLVIPKQRWVMDQDVTKFPLNAQPTFQWQTGTLPTIPAGYRLGYVIQIIKGEIQDMGGGNVTFMANWGDSNARIFDSWDKQNFPNALANTTFNWTVPASLTQEAVCDFGIGIVAIDKATNLPVAEGPRRGAMFIVGNPTLPALVQNQFQPTVNISTQTLTLEGKVHANILNDGRFLGGNLKVGLFKNAYDPTAGFSMTAVNGVTPVALTEVSGQTYKTFRMVFSGSVFGTNYGMYQVLLWNDANSDDILGNTETREFSVKMIDNRMDGAWANWPSGGDMLVNSQTNFNFIYWGDSF